MKVLYLILLTLFWVLACKQSTEPLQSQKSLTTGILANLTIKAVGYDSLLVSNPTPAITTEKEIQLIRIWQNFGGEREQLKEQSPSYSRVTDGYQIEFNIAFKVDRRTVFADLSIEFIKDSSNVITIDTSVAVFQYPYPQTEFLYFHSELLPENNIIQSFDFINDNIYLHGYGPSGLYLFKTANGNKQTLVNPYPGGDHLAAAADRIFLDIGHNAIYVFDLVNNQLSDQPIIEIPANVQYQTTGMTVIDQKLYVLWGAPDLHVYDFQGNLLQTIPYGKYTYGLTHKDGILYSIDFSQEQTVITRFDLQSQTFLESRAIPTSGTDIVQIKDEYLYFTDFYKQIMARVPLSALNLKPMN